VLRLYWGIIMEYESVVHSCPVFRLETQDQTKTARVDEDVCEQETLEWSHYAGTGKVKV
jgi:diphthamide synthase (EF-2-diphthine--ammonia ligase)